MVRPVAQELIDEAVFKAEASKRVRFLAATIWPGQRMDRENQDREEIIVSPIERTIDEDVLLPDRRDRLYAGGAASLKVSRMAARTRFLSR
jgi:hypothetical protein